MKIELWMIGKTSFSFVKEGVSLYENRLVRYLPFRSLIIPDVKNAKNLTPDLIKQKESELVLSKLKSDDYLILLDERGKQFSSIEFANFLEQKFLISQKQLVFLIGGAWGVSQAIYERADFQISISKMTLSHQIIRLFIAEQLYRALSIIKGEPYHNE